MSSAISVVASFDTDREDDATGNIQDFIKRYTTYPATNKMMNLIIYTQLSFDPWYPNFPIRIAWSAEIRDE